MMMEDQTNGRPRGASLAMLGGGTPRRRQLVTLVPAVRHAIASRPFTSLVLLAVIAIAVLAVFGAVVSDGDSSQMYLSNAGALVFAVWLYKRLERLAPDREVGLLRLTILLQYGTCGALVVASLASGGEFQYATATGLYSHATGGAFVAIANVVFSTAMCIPAFVRPGRGGPNARLRLDMAPGAVAILLVVAAGVVLLRGTLLFVAAGAPEVPVYFARLFVTYFGATVFFIGVVLRRGGSIFAVVLATATVVVSLVTLFAGSRWDSLALLGLVALGYLVAKPLSRGKLVVIGAAVVPVFVVALFVGEAVRQDHGERSGAAALGRMDRLAYRLESADTGSTVTASTVGRLVSNSTHAVLTRVPAEVPFDSGGLLSLPLSLIDTFLPRFNWTGESEYEKPRNWMLNDLGFLVNWKTSVELPLIPDAWYRGGWFGLIAVGLLAGTLLELAERLAYRVLRRRPEGVLLIIVMVTSLPSFVGRDIVWGTRAFAFNVIAAAVLLVVARLFSSWITIGVRR